MVLPIKLFALVIYLNKQYCYSVLTTYHQKYTLDFHTTASILQFFTLRTLMLSMEDRKTERRLSVMVGSQILGSVTVPNRSDRDGRG